jgi:hypothetical protein
MQAQLLEGAPSFTSGGILSGEELRREMTAHQQQPERERERERDVQEEGEEEGREGEEDGDGDKTLNPKP